MVPGITKTGDDLRHNHSLNATHHNGRESHWSVVVEACQLALLGHWYYRCFKTGGNLGPE